MTSILSCSADSNDITPVLKFMMEGSGHLILKCLLKFGTKTVGCKEDLFKLLWHWLQSKRTIDMAELDPLVYNGVCGVCVQLIADLCEMDSHSSRVKLASDALPEFTVFITNLLLLREDDPRCNSSKLTDERSSLDSLMLQTVQAYCRVTSLICSSRLVEEHSVMVIISEVALVYSDVATCSSSTISVVSACLVGLLQVLESLCTKLHSLAHTIAMSADVLQLLSSLLPGHMSQLIAAGQEELMKQTASSLVSAIKQMKEGKVSGKEAGTQRSKGMSISLPHWRVHRLPRRQQRSGAFPASSISGLVVRGYASSQHGNQTNRNGMPAIRQAAWNEARKVTGECCRQDGKRIALQLFRTHLERPSLLQSSWVMVLTWAPVSIRASIGVPFTFKRVKDRCEEEEPQRRRAFSSELTTRPPLVGSASLRPLDWGLLTAICWSDISSCPPHCALMEKVVFRVKVKHIHNLRCLRKKHRHCDLISNFHHHDDILSVEVFAKQECAVACLSRLLLNLYQILPQSFAIKMEILEWLTENSGCCCMAQVDFIVPLLSANLGDYSEQILHSILSSLTSLILHQLSGQATSKTPSCERCSPESLKHVEDMAGMSILQELVVSINNEERRKIILQHLCTMIGQCNSQLVFLLYRHVFKPILDLFYSDKSAVSMECIKTCLSAFIHSLTEDDCIDHFLSSAYSMKALELCVAEYNTLLPLVLQVLSLLIQLRSEEQVLTPLLTIILGEPGVQAPNSDFVMIELIYETPDFSAPISEKQMMLTNEKWTCCHRLLQQSSLFRSGFQSQSGVQLSLDVMGSIIPTLILENSLSSTQRHFLLQLLPTAIGCLQLSVHHQLTIGKAVFTIENLCSEIFKILQRCDFDSDREVSNERVFHILRLLLACSSHTLPARGTHRLCSQNDPEDFSLSQEEGSGKGDNSTKREERVSSSDRGASSSSDEYEADDESYVESSTPERCSFYDNLIQPEFWMLTFDLMTLETVSLTQSQISTLILDMDRLMHSVDSWQFLQHKAALVLKLLERYQQEVIDECDPLAGLVLSLVEYVSYLDMNSGILFKMLSLLKESCFKSHLLASVHTVITQSKCMPCSSIAFPLDRNDKERDIGVIVSQIDKFGTQPLSVILWLYLDGSISTGYNSQYKSKQPVQLMSITRSQLTITLQSEVTNGNICLLIGNLAGDVIGRVPVPSVLTTNKWQMVSFMADIKTKENLSLYVQFSLGVDGREIRAGTEAFTAPSKVIFDDQSNLDLHVGQRSNLYVKKESVHLAHTLIFTGCLTGLQCAELYSLGPSFNTFSRCIADIDAPLMDRRPLLCRRLPPSALQHLKSFSTSRLKQTLQALVTVIGPEYKPCCLFYNLYPLTSGDKFLSVANTKNRLLSFVSRVEEQPAAYYGQLSVVKHTGLEEAMANLGGSNLLLYMYAQCVELRLDESSQRLALECLLHSCTQSADLPLATQKPLDYKLLSKILHTEQCLVTPAITKVLINYAMRHVEADVLLVDMQFIEEVLLDWLIWQSRPQSWKPIWTALCQSVSAQNRFRQSNCMALLECEIPQTAVRIPSVQFQKNSDYSLSAWFTSQLALMVYRTLQCTHDKKLIQDICMHLLLLHPAAATFIEYDRSKLYPSTHWSTQLSSLRSNASSTLSLYRQTSDMSDTESICGLDDSDTFFSAKDETDDSKEGYTSEGAYNLYL
ncbi:uncharacterized protein [Watersipora subatra]|uniref:uncharacterized protein n=1 Tax=Watersipora subatra TaxID=2589382 RepID=UPI00355C5058